MRTGSDRTLTKGYVHSTLKYYVIVYSQRGDKTARAKATAKSEEASNLGGHQQQSTGGIEAEGGQSSQDGVI